MEKIIFIYPKRASFIDLDINILSKNYFVIANTYNWINKHTLPLALLNQFFFILKNIRASKYLVVSFGGYWSIIPSLLGKWFKKPGWEHAKSKSFNKLGKTLISIESWY